MNYYNQIKEELINNEINRVVKNYSINKSDLITYYNVGEMLSKAGKHYGEGIIVKYSKQLTVELGKKYNTSNLKRFRQFYHLIEKGAPMAHQLSWSHYQELIPIKDVNKINYYINFCINNNLSRNKLRELIKSKEYERLPNNTKEKLAKEESITIQDNIKNPIIIKNNLNVEKISEKVLHQSILEDIDNIMIQLGDGYSYIRHEYPIKIGSNYNYIDFLLFNINYNCYVVIEVKITKLKKEHIGQIETYMNYIDNNLRRINQETTIGIIMVKEDNKYIMKYCSNPNITSIEFILDKPIHFSGIITPR